MYATLLASSKTSNAKRQYCLLATFRRKNPRSVQAEDWRGGRKNCTDGQVYAIRV